MRHIVITTINEKTEAIEKFEEICKNNQYRLVVVGDNKTPYYRSTDHMKFLSIEQQFDEYGKLASLIPQNHYCRKNLGYLWAINNGATEIYDTDDDNIPYQNFVLETNNIHASKSAINDGWVNIYQYFSANQRLWPRGLPLDAIGNNVSVADHIAKDVDIFQGLADLDPDVDAIYRLLYKDEVKFNQNDNILLGQNAVCPFNSQNTIFKASVFPLLYLPCHVSFRMTDIWRSFVAQLARRQFDFNIGFGKATVYQNRNAHDLMKDFSDEVIGYLRNREIVESLGKVPVQESLLEYLLESAKNMVNVEIYEQRELEIIENWSEYLCN